MAILSPKQKEQKIITEKEIEEIINDQIKYKLNDKIIYVEIPDSYNKTSFYDKAIKMCFESGWKLELDGRSGQLILTRI